MLKKILIFGLVWLFLTSTASAQFFCVNGSDSKGEYIHALELVPRDGATAMENMHSLYVTANRGRVMIGDYLDCDNAFTSFGCNDYRLSIYRKNEKINIAFVTWSVRAYEFNAADCFEY